MVLSTAIKGERLGLSGLGQSAVGARRAPCCHWPQTKRFHHSRLTPARSLVAAFTLLAAAAAADSVSLLG